MTNPEQPNDDLARRLEWATSSQPPPADLDGEALQWREAWQAFGSRLESDTPPLDTDELVAKLRGELEAPYAPTIALPISGALPKSGAAATEGTPGGAWWLAIVVGVAAAIAGVWMVVRQNNVTNDATPSGVPLVKDKKVSPSPEKLMPEEKPSPSKVVEVPKPIKQDPIENDSEPKINQPSLEELTLTAWDDTEVSEALTQVQTQVYGAGIDWHESSLNLLDERLQELDKQMDDDGSL